MPDPASMMINWSSEVLISTQEVLPPTRMVSGPGVGIVPRTPQYRTNTCYLAAGNSLLLTAKVCISSVFLAFLRFCPGFALSETIKLRIPGAAISHEFDCYKWRIRSDTALVRFVLA